MKCYLKTENGGLKTQTKHPLRLGLNPLGGVLRCVHGGYATQ